MADQRYCPTCGQPVQSAERRLRDAIRAHLMETDTTQAALAEQLGITQKHMSQVLRGHVSLSLAMAERISAAIGLRLDVALTPVAEQGEGGER